MPRPSELPPDDDAPLQLVFYGECLPGRDPVDVREAVRAALGLDERRTARLFSGRRTVLSRSVDRATAHRRIARFAMMGAALHAEPAEVTAAAAPAPQPAPAPAPEPQPQPPAVAPPPAAATPAAPPTTPRVSRPVPLLLTEPIPLTSPLPLTPPATARRAKPRIHPLEWAGLIALGAFAVVVLALVMAPDLAALIDRPQPASAPQPPASAAAQSSAQASAPAASAAASDTEGSARD